MIFIDWISAPAHKNFNTAFFSNLKKNKHHKLFIFSNSLKNKKINCVLKKNEKNRFIRFLEIIKLCITFKNNSIFFLTYDPLLLPFTKLFVKKKIFTYEHNTVPEKFFNKHSIFQFFFFQKFIRFAQFKGQRKILRKLNQNVYYLGSPLLKINLKKNKIYKKSINKYFISGSDREDLSSLRKKTDLIKNYKIYVKKKIFTKSELVNKKLHNNFVFVKNIKLSNFQKNILGFIISINSSVRGTGWFNEAISRCIPIIILYKKTRKLFIETFPNYPHIFLDTIKNNNHLQSQIKKINKFKSKNYLIKHNRRFSDLLNSQIH